MESPLKNKYDIGVIVGRFQVPELMEGHKHVVDNVVEAHKQVIIVLGVSPTLGTKKNPLGYIPRMQMLQETYPDAIITHIMDINFDEVWSQCLDTLIRSLCPIGSVCLYGSRDSFISQYHGIYPTFEIGINTTKEGTKIREEVGKQVVDSVDFRKGVIYQSQNLYAKVFPTVDMAVLQPYKKGYKVLLGAKVNNDQYQFPGGFVDPSDENLEEAAVRELLEELEVEVDLDSIEYVGSNRQNDWRYRGPEECITTSLYKADYVFGSGEPLSEFHKTDWIEVCPESLEEVKEGHRPLFEKLIKNLKGDKKK